MPVERRNVLDAVERACKLRGASYRREKTRLYIQLSPERELKLRAGGGSGVLIAEAYVDGELDATSHLTEERAVALVRRLADT